MYLIPHPANLSVQFFDPVKVFFQFVLVGQPEKFKTGLQLPAILLQDLSWNCLDHILGLEKQLRPFLKLKWNGNLLLFEMV